MRPNICLLTMVALTTMLEGAPARADQVFQFSPFTVTAPDSRAFANSTVGSPGLLTPGTIVLDQFNQPIYNFLDTWQFALSPAADLIAFVGSINFTNPGGNITFGIDHLQVRMSGPSGIVIGWQSAIAYTGFEQMFSIIAQQPFQAGNYNLQVRGLLVGPQSSYAGTLQALQPVPLPPAMPLTATGLVGLGWLLRRSRTGH